jgi:hypothetical protein
VKPKRKTKRPQRRLLRKKPAFLAAFKICADLTASAAAVGINRGQHYDWLKEPNGKYKAAFEAAKVEADQSLHDSAVHRAMVGIYEPLVYQGRFSYPMEEYIFKPAVEAVEAVTALDWKDEGGPRAAVEARAAIPAVMGIRDVPGAPPLGIYRRSEMLHLALLRAHIPAFRTNHVEVTGANGGPIEIGIVERLNAARNRLAALKNAKQD